MTGVFIAYALCALVCAACALLLFRSYTRTRSRTVMWIAAAFAFLTASNVLLLADLFVAADLATSRAALVAIGLGVLIYGVVSEERR